MPRPSIPFAGWPAAGDRPPRETEQLVVNLYYYNREEPVVIHPGQGQDIEDLARTLAAPASQFFWLRTASGSMEIINMGQVQHIRVLPLSDIN